MDNILIEPQACNLFMHAKNKNDAIMKMCCLLEKAGRIEKAESFYSVVLEREKDGSTSIGHGIAIPHGKAVLKGDSCIAVARLLSPIQWETNSSEMVSEIILFVIREDEQNLRNVRMMAAIAKQLTYVGVRQELLNCRSKRRIVAFFEQIDVNEYAHEINIVAVTACPTGVAHTYIAKEILQRTAKKRGHHIRVETQGYIGTENRLQPEWIENADVVIIAADIKISGEERFDGCAIVEVPISIILSHCDQLFEVIENKLRNKIN